jgi:hypothetical protein
VWPRELRWFLETDECVSSPTLTGSFGRSRRTVFPASPRPSPCILRTIRQGPWGYVHVVYHRFAGAPLIHFPAARRSPCPRTATRFRRDEARGIGGHYSWRFWGLAFFANCLLACHQTVPAASLDANNAGDGTQDAAFDGSNDGGLTLDAGPDMNDGGDAGPLEGETDAGAVSCHTSRQCPGQVCASDLSVCVDCNIDSDCDSTQRCREHTCETRPRTCATTADCAGSGMICNPRMRECVACIVDSDCQLPRHYCDISGACLPWVCEPGSSQCPASSAMNVSTCDSHGAQWIETRCPDFEVCGSATGKARCICPAEDDAHFCNRLGKTCGIVGSFDLCQQSRTVDCGMCPNGSACNSQNVCGCAGPAGCNAGMGCCLTTGLCYPLVMTGTDCDCQHPCKESDACMSDVCGSAAPKCRSGCFSGDSNRPAQACGQVSGHPAFCDPVPTELKTGQNQGGACVPGDVCDVVKQNCLDEPLRYIDPVGPGNPLVPRGCVPIAPNVNACLPAGTLQAGDTGCILNQCAAVAGQNCQKGLACVIDSSDPSGSMGRCFKLCPDPSGAFSPPPSPNCPSPQSCVQFIGAGNEVFAVGYCD